MQKDLRKRQMDENRVLTERHAYKHHQSSTGHHSQNILFPSAAFIVLQDEAGLQIFQGVLHVALLEKRHKDRL